MTEPEAKKTNFTLINNDELEHNFRCQICKLYLFGNIMTCSNGHSTCELCYNMLIDITCGQCRDNNIKLDKLTSRYMSCYSIEKECPYQCQIKFNSLNYNIIDESNHLKKCVNRQFKCLFCNDFYFKISETNQNYKTHLINNHNVIVITTPLYIDLILNDSMLNIYNKTASYKYFYEHSGKQYLILITFSNSNFQITCFEFSLEQKSSSRFNVKFVNKYNKHLTIENYINTIGEININQFYNILLNKKYQNILSLTFLNNYFQNIPINDNLVKMCLKIIPSTPNQNSI